MTNKPNLLETHHYDGLLGDIYRQLIEHSTHQQLMSFEQSINQIDQWITQSAISDKSRIISALQLIKNDSCRNYDNQNGLSVEEILPHVIDVVSQFDQSGIDLFLQNLGEIVELGSCPQGRTTRLLGFYIPFK